MAMQYDVKAAYTESDAAMVTYPVRIKGAGFGPPNPIGRL